LFDGSSRRGEPPGRPDRSSHPWVPALQHDVHDRRAGFCAEMLCLALVQPHWIGAGLPRRWCRLACCGLFRLQYREFALAAPIAVLVAAAVQDSWRRPAYWLAGLSVVVTCAGIVRLVTSLPGYVAITPLALFSLENVALIQAITMPALIMSPILVLPRHGGGPAGAPEMQSPEQPSGAWFSQMRF